MATSTLRGWPITYDSNLGEWVFDDNWRPTKDSYKERPCMKCGAEYDDDFPDPCLGELPGVANACCGHGEPGMSYIQFNNGVTIRGFQKVDGA